MHADQRWVSIPGLVRARGEDFAGQEALVDEGGAVRLSFAELSALLVRSTRAAIAAGLEPGDRAAIWAPNMHEWIVAALGVPRRGGRPRAAQHPVQGRRGRRTSSARAGPGCCSR